MKKRLVSMLVVAVMLIGILPAFTVSADVTYSTEPPEGWSTAWPDSAYGYAKGEREMVLATGESYSGNNSLYVKFAADVIGKYAWLGNDNTGTITQSGVYTLTYYMKNTLSTGVAMTVRAGNSTTWLADGEESTPENAEKAAEGWKKYTVTLTNPTQLLFCVETINGVYDTAIYLDDMSLTLAGSTENLLANGNFENEEISEPTPVPTEVTYSDLIDGWVAAYTTSGCQPDGSARMTKLATGVSYSGNNSMYIKHDTAGYFWIYNLGLTGTLPEETYTLSMYIKNMKASLPQFSVRYSTIKMLSDFEASVPEDETKAAEGWMKYTVILRGMTSFGFVMDPCDAELYIDDMTLTSPQVNDSKTNLLMNPGFEGSTAVTAPASTEPLQDWYTTYQNNYLEGKTQVIATGVSYSGNKSMYLALDADTSNPLFLQNIGIKTALDASKTYTLTYYAKGITNGDTNRIELGAKWWNRFTQWNNPQRGLKKLTEVESSLPEDAAKAAEGWRKYSTTFNYNAGDAAPSVPRFIIEKKCAFYIDDLTLVDTSTGENLFVNSDMEGATMTEPDSTEDFWQWTTAPTRLTANDSITMVNGVAYEGNSSMRVKWQGGSNKWCHIGNDNITSLPGSGTYSLSFYAKGAVPQFATSRFEMGSTWLKKWWNSNNNVAAGNVIQLCEFDVSLPEDAEKAAEGWRKYTYAAVPNPTAFSILIEGAVDMDIYFDNFTFTAAGSNVNLLSNGTFEERYVPPFPDLTGQPLDAAKWLVNPVNQELSGYTYVVESTAAEAFVGSRSMHIQFTKGAGDPNVDNPVQIAPTYTVDTNTSAGKTWKATMYIKNVSGANNIWFVPFSWPWVKDASGGTATDKEGWYKYEISGIIPDTKQSPSFVIETRGDMDIYVDGFTLEVDGVEVLGDSGSFEFTSTNPYDVSKVVLCDAGRNELAGLSDDLAGKTVELGVAVANNQETSMTAQLIICLYKGYEMIDCSISDLATINKADGFVTIQDTIALPNTSLEDYEIRAYVWDSLQNLRALTPNVAVF